MKTIKYILLSAILIGFTACSDDDSTGTDAEPLPPLTAGSADFSKYVAVGASFTAGFTDNALFIAGQENSFPNILSQQFASAGGGTFTQPMMSDNNGGLLFGGNIITNVRLYLDLTGPSPSPTPINAVPTTEATNVLAEPFNNYGIPGAKSFHLLAPGYGNLAGVPVGLANPYFARMASSSTASVIGDAVAQNPTFFTLSEVGGNDVLGYALSGGESNTSAANYNPITPTAQFDAAFNMLVEQLTANDAKGVVANVPYITSLPHFTTVPYNPVPLDAATANALNQGYAQYNGGLQQALAALNGTGLFTAEEVAKRTINFSAGEGNALVVIDENLTDLGAINPAFAAIPKYRQATADDLFVLPLSSLIPNGYGTQIPLEDKWVLTPEEQMEIIDATDAYNQTIEAVAAEYDLALVDFKSILIEASTTGFSDGDFTLTTNLVTGGLVSLDGVHLTSRGYAVMANQFLKAIDAKYGSNFIAAGVKANPGSYPTNFPEDL